MQRRIVILAEGKFSPLESKTANQAIRYIPDEIVGVIDSRHAGKVSKDILGFGGDIPVFANLRSSLQQKPDTLLVGIAPTGGQLPELWRSIVKEAIGAGLNVVSGLHTLLSEDDEFASLARKVGVQLTDLRKVPDEYNVVAKGNWRTRTAKTILTVGTDCNVGKMTASLELHREFLRRGKKSDFIATGQTGILLAGKGVAVDHLIADFIAGAIELEIDRSASAGNEYLFVEGQGALQHPGYSAVTLGLMHGTMPDAMVLVHHPIRETNDYGISITDVNASIRLHEEFFAPFSVHSKVVGIAINTVMMTPTSSGQARREIERETNLPVGDVLKKEGVGQLADALDKYFNNPGD